jgi:hypothetical protein
MHAHFRNTFADGFTVAEIANAALRKRARMRAFPLASASADNTRRTPLIEE